MADLQSVLAARVADGTVPGLVALVAQGERVEVAAAGSVDVEGSAPMARDTVFRLASITKPITAAAVRAATAGWAARARPRSSSRRVRP